MAQRTPPPHPLSPLQRKNGLELRRALEEYRPIWYGRILGPMGVLMTRPGPDDDDQNRLEALRHCRGYFSGRIVSELKPCLPELPNEIVEMIISHAIHDDPDTIQVGLVSQEHPRSLRRLEEVRRRDLAAAVENALAISPRTAPYEEYRDALEICVEEQRKLQYLVDDPMGVGDGDEPLGPGGNWASGRCCCTCLDDDVDVLVRAHNECFSVSDNFRFGEDDFQFGALAARDPPTNGGCVAIVFTHTRTGIETKTVALWNFERSQLVSVLKNVFVKEVKDCATDRDHNFVVVLTGINPAVHEDELQSVRKRFNVPSPAEKVTVWATDTGSFLHVCQIPDHGIQPERLSLATQSGTSNKLICHDPNNILIYEIDSHFSTIMSDSAVVTLNERGRVVCLEGSRILVMAAERGANAVVYDISDQRQSEVEGSSRWSVGFDAAFDSDPAVDAVISIDDNRVRQYLKTGPRLHYSITVDMPNDHGDSGLKIASYGDHFAAMYHVDGNAGGHSQPFQIVVGNMTSQESKKLTCSGSLVHEHVADAVGTCNAIAITRDKLYTYHSRNVKLIWDFSLNPRQIVDLECSLIEKKLSTITKKQE